MVLNKKPLPTNRIWEIPATESNVYVCVCEEHVVSLIISIFYVYTRILGQMGAAKEKNKYLDIQTGFEPQMFLCC